MINYFAYGSNMSLNRMKSRNINFYNEEVGILENYKLVINKKSGKNPTKGFANIIDSENELVEGVLYQINENDLKLLDKFEGYPKHYSRKNVPIKLKNGNIKGAIVYIAAEEWVSKNKLEIDYEYKDFILEGKNFVSDKYYKFLEKL
jgi:gamma-glutamylcyclotransferase (GGCT)/AIG2-like uncharacterized protein YtfP